VREIRSLRAMRRELETEPRRRLFGHEGGNPGNRQGHSYGPPRQFSTLPPLVPTGHRQAPFVAGRLLEPSLSVFWNPAPLDHGAIDTVKCLISRVTVN